MIGNPALKQMHSFVLFSSSYFNSCSVKLQMLLGWIACDAALQPVDLGTEAGIPVWDEGKILHRSFRAWDSFLPKIY